MGADPIEDPYSTEPQGPSKDETARKALLRQMDLDSDGEAASPEDLQAIQ